MVYIARKAALAAQVAEVLGETAYETCAGTRVDDPAVVVRAGVHAGEFDDMDMEDFEDMVEKVSEASELFGHMPDLGLEELVDAMLRRVAIAAMDGGDAMSEWERLLGLMKAPRSEKRVAARSAAGGRDSAEGDFVEEHMWDDEEVETAPEVEEDFGYGM